MDSDSDSEFIDFEVEADKALSNLMPEKSKPKYEKAYKSFKDWCAQNNAGVIDEKKILVYFSRELKDLKSSTKQDMYKFIREASDNEFLAMKAALIIGIYGCCRRDELVNMGVDQMKFTDNPSSIIVRLPKTKTYVIREFVVSEGDDPNINLVDIVKKYAALRPSDVSFQRFFLCYRKSTCVRQPIGIHTIGGFPAKIAKFLKLENPNLYTGHCYRRSGISMMAEAGADMQSIKRQGGWSSDSVAEGYIECSRSSKVKISGQILGTKSTSTGTASTSMHHDSASSKPATVTSNSAMDDQIVHLNETVDAFEQSDSVDRGERGFSLIQSQSHVIRTKTESHVIETNASTSSAQQKNNLEIKVLSNCTINIFQK